MQVLPVIHFLDRMTALEQVGVAQRGGAHGVFLISHHGNDEELVDVAAAAKRAHPNFRIGINLLSEDPLFACRQALSARLDMVWGDDFGVDSTGANALAESLARYTQDVPSMQLFASVAFKYRPFEPDPVLAATLAQRLGFIATTSGTATGSAPEIHKISAMSQATDGQLAIASGMTPENVAQYAPYVTHMLVATGIGYDEYRIDPQRLSDLIANGTSKGKQVQSGFTNA